MTREEEIRTTAIRSCGPLSEWSGSTIDAFVKGAQWADANQTNPWHDASKELPEMSGLYLVYNGRMCQTIRYNKEQNRWGVNPWMIVSVKYWMPIPEIEKED